MKEYITILKALFFIVFVIFLSSCYRLRGSVNFDSPNKTDLTKIKTNGYYYHVSSIPEQKYDSISREIITVKEFYRITPLVFYKDGLVYFIYRGKKENKEIKDTLYSSSLPHQNLNEFWIQENDEFKVSKKHCINWGKYSIKEDSIFIRYYDRAWEHIVTRSSKLIPQKLNGIILNDSTIEITRHWGRKEVYHFNVSELKPDSTFFKKTITAK